MPIVKPVKNGFVRAWNDNSPNVSSIAMANFFCKNADFLAPEMRHRKTLRSARADYGDDAIAYPQVKRERGLCTVIAEITPKHRVRSGNYSVIFIIDEKKNEILKATCNDCAASEGGCKHCVAFVTWLHRRSSEPSPTSRVCYWKNSQLSRVGSSLKFIRSKQLARKIPLKPSKKKRRKKRMIPTISENEKKKFFDSVVAEFENNSEDILLLRQLSRQSSYSIHHLLLDFKATAHPKTGESFMHFARSSMEDAKCEVLAKATIDQANNPLWFEMRFGRISASKLHEAARCRTKDGSLVATILGAVHFDPTEAMKRGTALESAVRKVVAQTMNLRFQQIGFMMNRKYPIFGASPDAITKEYVIEIKCPESLKTYKTYFKNKVEPALKHKAQMTLQMLMCNRIKGLFCVASPKFEKNKKVEILEVAYDESFCQSLLSGATKFWLANIFPVLFSNLL